MRQYRGLGQDPKIGAWIWSHIDRDSGANLEPVCPGCGERFSNGAFLLSHVRERFDCWNELQYLLNQAGLKEWAPVMRNGRPVISITTDHRGRMRISLYPYVNFGPWGDPMAKHVYRLRRYVCEGPDGNGCPLCGDAELWSFSPSEVRCPECQRERIRQRDKRGPYRLTCRHCGAAFESKRKDRRYCCNAHRQAAYRERGAKKG